MNYNRHSRIFINDPFSEGNIHLSELQSHYLTNVMRKKISDQVVIFNGIDGEYLAEINAIRKKQVVLKATKKLKAQVKERELVLIFALIKNHRLNYLIEKATEMGVTEFVPIVTQHSVRDKFNIAKAKSWVIEACEQSERLSVPSISDPVKLDDLIKSWDPQAEIIFANESESGCSFSDLGKKLHQDSKYAILIGPEGGFSDDEKKTLSNLEFIRSVHLGPRILRSESAAICAISCMQLLLNNLSSRNL